MRLTGRFALVKDPEISVSEQIPLKIPLEILRGPFILGRETSLLI
jgi:hypothetical protein